MERFGAGEVKGIRACGMYGCKNVASVFIGDTKQQHAVKNFFLCDKHAKIILDELSKRYAHAFESALDEQNNQSNIKGQTAIKDYLTALYENNGVISKAKMVELCQKHEIEIPEETPNMKTLMEMLFKDELEI